MPYSKNRPFFKMHGLGNDFVVIDGREDGFVLDKDLCLRIADRHRGIGCDQVIVLGGAVDPNADLFMHMFNPDGSEAGACGNGTRCVAKLLFEEKNVSSGIVQTVAGLLSVWREESGLVTVDFGPPRLSWDQIPLAHEQDTVSVTVNVADLPPACCVSMGNPHAVFFVDDAQSVSLETIGPRVENNALFPERTNVEFVHQESPDVLRMRVWERGTGITQACGSGAAATFVAAVRRGFQKERGIVRLDGGDLEVAWRRADGHVTITGPAVLSFRGTMDESF